MCWDKIIPSCDINHLLKKNAFDYLAMGVQVQNISKHYWLVVWNIFYFPKYMG
jgi:hypothetical protein